MRDLLARGKPAYVARQGLGPHEAIAAIRAAGVSQPWRTSPTRRRAAISSPN